MLDDFAWIAAKYGEEPLIMDKKKRKYTVMFHGSVERGVQTHVDNTSLVNLNYTEGQLRGLLCDKIDSALNPGFGIDNTTLKCVAKWKRSALRSQRMRHALNLMQT